MSATIDLSEAPERRRWWLPAPRLDGRAAALCTHAARADRAAVSLRPAKRDRLRLYARAADDSGPPVVRPPAGCAASGRNPRPRAHRYRRVRTHDLVRHPDELSPVDDRAVLLVVAVSLLRECDEPPHLRLEHAREREKPSVPRSWSRVVIATCQPPPSSPSRFSFGTTDVGEEDLVELGFPGDLPQRAAPRLRAHSSRRSGT